MEIKHIVLYAFLGITTLTAVAVLVAALKLFGVNAPELVTWGMPAVLGGVASSVFVVFRGEWGSKVDVNMAFNDADFLDLDFEPSKCRYKVHDWSGKEIDEGNVHPILGQGGWAVKIPVVVTSDQSLSLELVSSNGDQWVVRPFLPLVHTKQAIQQ